MNNNRELILEDLENNLEKIREHEINIMTKNPYQIRYVNRFLNVYRGIGNTHHLVNLAKENHCFLVVPNLHLANNIQKIHNYKYVGTSSNLPRNKEYIVDSITAEELEKIISENGKEPIAGLVLY